MISYKDKTFCTEDTCASWEGCHRALTDEVIGAAIEWGGVAAPLSMFMDAPECYESTGMYDNMRDVLIDEGLEGC